MLFCRVRIGVRFQWRVEDNYAEMGVSFLERVLHERNRQRGQIQAPHPSAIAQTRAIVDPQVAGLVIESDVLD